MAETGPYFHRDLGTDPKLAPLLVFIEEKAVKNERASEAGEAVYDRVLFLRVLASGQKFSSPIFEAWRHVMQPDGTEKQKIDQLVYRRFKGVCDEWQSKAAPSQSGTPLEQWPLMDVALVQMFKDANVYTVQALAGLPDSALENVRGKAREWRAKAQAWLEDARDAGRDVEARATISRLEATVDEMRTTISQLTSGQNKPQGFKQSKPRSDRRPMEIDDGVLIGEEESDRRL